MIRLPQAGVPSASLLPDLTPLLDVIFIVLVFFLLTAQQPLLELPLDLPKSASAPSAAEHTVERTVIMLDEHGAWRFAGQPQADFNTLRAVLEQQPPDAVDLALHQQAPLEQFLQLLAVLQTLGIDDTQILMEAQGENAH
ncbi:biopolymer transporter ExbD [Denitrificimonas sp. JX-1]|uniref:Biopolymer transporter ExbD n=1 Tax=Denitrificimonas halotolerans TaxID=3098930 RepID=A0ABU5GRK9_9GAMM|nr:biopolymer transporter ExbD [Denitrificimonas sp. JX-1]MDY7219325.1 biopolymer transporter ExbD [Denitrificimonas sp. JX-1]